MRTQPARARAATVLLATLAVLAGLVVAAPAQAAVPSVPTGLAPDGDTVNSIPVLSWNRQDDASTYDVQVSTSSSFVSTVWSTNASTWNDKVTPTVQLPLGTLYWRVRAKNGGGTLSDWATASFLHQSVSPPTPTAPADNAVLKPPADTPVFQWSAVPGATSYVVRVGQDQDFTDPSRFVVLNAVQARAATLNGLLQPNTYYWEVQAQLGSGYTTDWSAPRSLTIQGLDQPALQGPTDDINAAVQDVVLDWSAVPGAVTFDLQVSTDSGFNTTEVSQSGITGTRFSPPVTLNNDQYYWRVRAVDAGGFTASWNLATIWHFKRNWPDQPQLLYPQDGQTIGDPVYFQWTPVPHASRYVFQISTDAAFTDVISPPNPVSCETKHTTFTPVEYLNQPNRRCMPSAYGTYYWRVYALDDPRQPDLVQTDYIAAQIHSFTYAPEAVTQTSPANGSSVTVPTMSWQPLAGASQYKVTLTDTSTGTTTSTVTDSTSFTPRTALNAATYRWAVQTVSVDGRLGAMPTAGSQPTFTVVAAPTATATSPDPTSTNLGSKRFPTLTWQAVANATKYRLYVRRAGATGWNQVGGSSTTFAYPAGQDLGDTYATSGTDGASQQYEWYVEAYNGNALLGAGSVGTYVIDPPPVITGFQAGLTGDDITGGAGSPIDSCGATLPSECQNLRQTPALKWDPNPNIGSYRIYLTYDGANNGVNGYFPVNVASSLWMGTESLPDSQAGSAYYWTVVPCTSPNSCARLDHASHAFNKQSNQVVLDSPVSPDPSNPVKVPNDVTLTWDDYLATETAASGTGTALSSPAETEARQYRVQVSTTADFAVKLEDRLVDQTTFTSFSTTFPEGVLYWRVQAVDGSNNNGNWSDTGIFEKRSPSPTLTYPVSPSPGVLPQVNGTNAFTWQPLKFAKSYDLEVYKNDDMVGQSANRLLSASSLVVAYAPSTLLPVSSTPYTWRVRRVDAAGRKGAWSPFQEFLVTGDSPTLTSPVNGSAQAPNDTLYTWLPTTGAAKYRFERRLAGSGTIAESVTTVATSYAETMLLGTGTWQWRVTALDANSNPLGDPGNWTDMQFTVDGGLAATTDVSTSGSGAVDTILTLSPPSWNLPGVTTTYQWLRSGSPISGQTAESYTVTKDDVGKSLSVRATGTKAGYTNGISVSAPVTGAAGPAPVASVDPSISGTPKVGELLTADPGVWPGTTPKYTYQWLRNGNPISNATGSSYRLQTADAGRKVAVRVTATITGYLPGSATSGAVAVRKLASATAITLPSAKIRKSAHGKVAVTVTVPGISQPTGTLKAYVDGAVKVTKALTATKYGKMTLTLPLLTVGRHKVYVRYLGNAQVAASKSTTVTLSVTK